EEQAGSVPSGDYRAFEERIGEEFRRQEVCRFRADALQLARQEFHRCYTCRCEDSMKAVGYVPEALAARSAGVNLERKKGSGKSRLEPYKEEIVALLRNSSPKNFVAQRYTASEPTLYNSIEK